jgi:hypothetical protein
VLLEVDPAPDNGWQEQSKQRAPITKDEDENSSWSCDAHGVDTCFPVEIDEEKEEGPDKITKHHNGRKQRRMSGKQYDGATRYDAHAKSNGWFLSVLVGMSRSNLAFALVSQISNVLRGTIAAKSVVIHVTATNGSPRNKE